jgi:hypothetical protein
VLVAAVLSAAACKTTNGSQLKDDSPDGTASVDDCSKRDVAFRFDDYALSPTTLVDQPQLAGDPNVTTDNIALTDSPDDQVPEMIAAPTPDQMTASDATPDPTSSGGGRRLLDHHAVAAHSAHGLPAP